MQATRLLVLLSFLSVVLLLSCDFRDSDTKGILDPTGLVEKAEGPIPGLLSESAPEPGPATGGPEPDLAPVTSHAH